MEAVTRSTNKIYVSKAQLAKIVEQEQNVRMARCRAILDGFVEGFSAAINKEWVRIENKEMYYVGEFNILVADTLRWSCPYAIYDYSMFDGKGRALTYNEAKTLFYDKKAKNPLVRNDYIRTVTSNNTLNEWSCVKYYNGSYSRMYASNGDYYDCGYNGYSNSNGLNIPVHDCEKNLTYIEIFIKEDLIPEGLTDEFEEILAEIKDLYKKGKVKFNNNEADLDTSAVFRGIKLDKKEIEKYVLSNTVSLTEENRAMLFEEPLNCDYVRAEIEPYDERILTDPNRGHWDLWTEKPDSGKAIETDITLIGRNPAADIKHDGIIGIDFGTKSTIVVYQDGDTNTLPVRVGRGKYKKEVKKDDYENPTVMEFINLTDFMERYNAKAGRPETLWEDITVSHKAAEQLKNGSDSSKFYSFFSDLKQWSGDKTRQIRIRDDKGKEIVLPAFVDIEENDFNPIELYAYYLGLFINNMYKGIYLNYLLSFPVTYEKAVRKKIIESFERGIKKSLPVEVLEDGEIMEEFRVIQGASEPAAYAICALQQYGFEPEEDKPDFYGIFDFGGGTTDFDFGLWRCAKGVEARRYDYVIEHFGSGGDQYLGGENLLELLAFNVFKDNMRALIDAGIAFYKPNECKEFAGSEMLISGSQEAKLNTKQLMEKLRGLWQNDNDEDIKAIEEGKIKVMLFNNGGNPMPNFELAVEKTKLEEILYERIEKGVRNFFDAIQLNFKRADLSKVESINIFLAGNSSKSPIVKELFEKYIQERTEDIVKRIGIRSANGEDADAHVFFRIFPPLGSEEAKQLQREKGLQVSDNDLIAPTGKTGVAYGLIEGRPGSRVKVIAEVSGEDEVKFKYYLGYPTRGKFIVAMDRNVGYNKWVQFIDASEKDFEIYYTSLPEAATNSLDIAEISRKLCRIDAEDDEAFVYIRFTEPTVIEYCVATEDGIKNDRYIEQPERVELK